jgi:hypothetical protein
MRIRKCDANEKRKESYSIWGAGAVRECKE